MHLIPKCIMRLYRCRTTSVTLLLLLNRLIDHRFVNVFFGVHNWSGLARVAAFDFSLAKRTDRLTDSFQKLHFLA